jgi:uncharacterized protein YfaT (DUF1175 family)
VIGGGPRRALAGLGIAGVMLVVPAQAQLRLADESDRLAFRAWFVLLADAAYYQPPAEAVDCAALVRYAMREALRPHTAEWQRRAALPLAPAIADVVSRPAASGGMMPLFRVSPGAGAPLAEFADARTLVRWNTTLISRDTADARPGDLLYFRQAGQRYPDHLMIVVGASRLDPSAADFVVYHTGPDVDGPGEIRKVRLATLLRHPSPRWRPTAINPSFSGVFRLRALT